MCKDTLVSLFWSNTVMIVYAVANTPNILTLPTAKPLYRATLNYFGDWGNWSTMTQEERKKSLFASLLLVVLGCSCWAVSVHHQPGHAVLDVAFEAAAQVVGFVYHGSIFKEVNLQSSCFQF